MSLFIIGSVSRITSNIVLQLAKNKQYSQIAIGDLLPCYSYHKRFYRLQRELDNLQYGTKVSVRKISFLNDLLAHQKYDDVLFVTHDYYTNVISKTNLMEKTALACKNRKHLFFATPVQYDHFGYSNPQKVYSKAQSNVLQINPNATFIRSDVQDKGEALAYFNLPNKNYFQSKVFQSKFYFSPNVVKTHDYARIVCDVMAKRVQGKKFIVRGAQAKDPIYADINSQIAKQQYNDAKQNIVSLAQKYNGLRFPNYQPFQLKSQTSQKNE